MKKNKSYGGPGDLIKRFFSYYHHLLLPLPPHIPFMSIYPFLSKFYIPTWQCYIWQLCQVGLTGGDELAKLTEGKLAKLKVLIDQSFSNGEISRAIGVSDETVRKHRGGKKVDIRTSKSNRSIKKSGERRPGDPGNDISQKRGEDPESTGQDITPGEETKESTGDPGPERIEFIGGNKPMVKEDNTTEDSDLACADCGTALVEGQKICPGCGKEMDWDKA